MRLAHVERPSQDKIDDAREQIATLFEHGERPIVTIPIKYREYLKTGLRAHSTWIPCAELLTATFGRPPYLPDNEDRLIVRIKDIELDHISPRFTGPDNDFHGVVVISGPVAPEQLEFDI
ncbi:MAG TPA: hypothetical protein VJJ22_05225 [Candidatus Paceibacterota bacterium]